MLPLRYHQLRPVHRRSPIDDGKTADILPCPILYPLWLPTVAAIYPRIESIKSLHLLSTFLSTFARICYPSFYSPCSYFNPSWPLPIHSHFSPPWSGRYVCCISRAGRCVARQNRARGLRTLRFLGLFWRGLLMTSSLAVRPLVLLAL